MTYDAKDIAEFILAYCHEKKLPMTNLRLQKILYFIWEDYYIEKQEHLFNNDICAWKLGPVLPDVYVEYCMYAAAPIRFNDKCLSDLKVKERILEKDQSIIEEALNKYTTKSTRDLVDMSHEKNKPWDKTYQNGAGNKNIISFDLIKNSL